MNPHTVFAGLCLMAILSSYVLYRLTAKPWLSAIICYIVVGFLGVALPLSYALPATNYFGILFLTVAWVPWVGQNVFGYDLVSMFPVEFWSLLFDF